MSRLRVLRVIARMNVGGPALQVVALTEGLDPERFEQRLLVGDVAPGEGDYLELRAPDLPVTRVPGLGRSPNPLGDVRALGRIAREIRAFRPHIVHTHTAKAGALGRVAARTLRVPAVVHHFHGHLLHGYFSPAATRGVAATERALARLSTRLVAVGEQVRADLLEARIGRADQYTVIPPGIELPAPPARDEARRLLDLPPRAPVVVFVARLTRIKRPDRFVAVARAVTARRPDVVFAVAGEGDLLEEMRAAGRDLGARLRFLGWRPDVETVYAAADAVLLTSDNEGMPVSLIEAAWCGCPAVTTRVGSAPEVVEHGVTGFVVGPDVEELAEATVRLLDDPSRGKMAGAAADGARRRFSRQRLVADVAELYEAIARERHLDG